MEGGQIFRGENSSKRSGNNGFSGQERETMNFRFFLVRANWIASGLCFQFQPLAKGFRISDLKKKRLQISIGTIKLLHSPLGLIVDPPLMNTYRTRVQNSSIDTSENCSESANINFAALATC